MMTKDLFIYLIWLQIKINRELKKKQKKKKIMNPKRNLMRVICILNKTWNCRKLLVKKIQTQLKKNITKTKVNARYVYGNVSLEKKTKKKKKRKNFKSFWIIKSIKKKKPAIRIYTIFFKKIFWINLLVKLWFKKVLTLYLRCFSKSNIIREVLTIIILSSLVLLTQMLITRHPSSKIYNPREINFNNK